MGAVTKPSAYRAYLRVATREFERFCATRRSVGRNRRSVHLTAAAATNLCLIPARPENRQLNGTQPSVASASYPTGRRQLCRLKCIFAYWESAALDSNCACRLKPCMASLSVMNRSTWGRTKHGFSTVVTDWCPRFSFSLFSSPGSEIVLRTRLWRWALTPPSRPRTAGGNVVCWGNNGDGRPKESGACAMWPSSPSHSYGRVWNPAILDRVHLPVTKGSNLESFRSSFEAGGRWKAVQESQEAAQVSKERESYFPLLAVGLWQPLCGKNAKTRLLYVVGIGHSYRQGVALNPSKNIGRVT